MSPCAEKWNNTFRNKDLDDRVPPTFYEEKGGGGVD